MKELMLTKQQCVQNIQNICKKYKTNEIITDYQKILIEKYYGKEWHIYVYDYEFQNYEYYYNTNFFNDVIKMVDDSSDNKTMLCCRKPIDEAIINEMGI